MGSATTVPAGNEDVKKSVKDVKPLSVKAVRLQF
jgi:hypothetical protein